MPLMTTLAALILAVPISTEASTEQLQQLLKQTAEPRIDSSLTLPDGSQLSLDLEEFEVFEAGAEVVVQYQHGTRPADLGGLRLWRGHVKGDPESRVFIAVSRHFTEGYVQFDGGLFFMGTGPNGQHPLKLTDAATIPQSVMDVPGCEIRTVDGEPPRPERP